MFETLTNHYNDWQKKWRDKLNLPSAPTEETGENPLGTQAPAATPMGGLGDGNSTATTGAAPTGGAGAQAAAPSI